MYAKCIRVIRRVMKYILKGDVPVVEEVENIYYDEVWSLPSVLIRKTPRDRNQGHHQTRRSAME